MKSRKNISRLEWPVESFLNPLAHNQIMKRYRRFIQHFFNYCCHPSPYGRKLDRAVISC